MFSSDMKKLMKPKDFLCEIYRSALLSVNGEYSVDKQLRQLSIEGNVAVLAIGKAASAMIKGATNVLSTQIQSALLITKTGYVEQILDYLCLEAGHPIPNQQSLDAGIKLLNFLENIPQNTQLVALISGGTSALVDVLPSGFDLSLLQKMNKWLLASGLNIHDMNRIRQSVSLIKGGKTLNYLKQKGMTQFLISDVKDDDLNIIGSGLFSIDASNVDSADKIDFPDWLRPYVLPQQPNSDKTVKSYIVANNEVVCLDVVKHVKQAGLPVYYHGQTLYGDVFEISGMLAKDLKCAEPGIHIWGGEPSIVLPDKIGRGGRNQSLALSLACHLENIKGITILVGATDGSDGATDDAGAIIDGFTLQRGAHCGLAKNYLLTADAGTYLAESGDLFSTGPTGTNVMDIVIALKESI